MNRHSFSLPPIVALLIARLTLAHDAEEMDDFVVEGRATTIVGEAVSASEGYIGRVDLDNRPLLRPGEILETVPGLIATQHSGSGKANQYFLRGFNLDHGTDFATFVDGMPVNMVSHGHGQGYTDLNFLIPETVELLAYQKGSYDAQSGDFTGAGSARIQTSDIRESGLASLSLGEHNGQRALVIDTLEIGHSNLLFALERELNDGPWELDEDLDKINGLLKFSHQHQNDRLAIGFMGYDSTWNSTDQIPLRAITQNRIRPSGFLDPTVGGESSRYSLNASWERNNTQASTRLSAYSIYYDMDLWSNFTYFLEDPIDGDQFEQVDRRFIYGFSATHSLENREFFQRSARHYFGLDIRYDDVNEVGLFRTKERERIGTIREDTLTELATSLYGETEIQWNGKLKTTFGARVDRFDFDVDSDTPANSGKAHDTIFSPKTTLIYTLSESTELYLNYGYGFHSNDARGTTITVDPVDKVTPIDSVDLLVRSTGAEAGVRLAWNQNLNTSISLWSLDLDSELLYVGDAGSTESSGPSERYGIEIANHYAPNDWISFDLDLSFTESKFGDADPSEDNIPGAIDTVASAGITFAPSEGWYGSFRLRHFGDRPLVEDGSIRSPTFTAFNTRVGYIVGNWNISLDILNTFDSDDHDITYFYESRLADEPAGGAEDIHFHPIEPRNVKLNITWSF